MDGSFCLFCGNGAGCSRLAWLLKLRVAAWAGLMPASRPTQTAMVIAKGLQIALIAQPPHPLPGRSRPTIRAPATAEHGYACVLLILTRPAARMRISSLTRGLGPSVLGDQLPEDQGQDAAVVQVAHLGFVVRASVSRERLSVPVVGDRFDLDPLAWLDLLQAADRVALATGETKRLHILAGGEREGQDAHSDQVGAVDSLEAFRDHHAHALEERTFRGPVA